MELAEAGLLLKLFQRNRSLHLALHVRDHPSLD
jgi:hypothetical protein